MTTETFAQRGRELYGDKYDYSKVEYKGGDVKVCIICPEHGEFWQLPFNHLRGNQCPKCNKYRSISKEEFIEKSNIVHNGKYDYSKVDFIDCHTKVCIVCPVHGDFYQTPTGHMRGFGCKLCANKTISIKNTETLENFLERAERVHGGRYDYSKTEYHGLDKETTIICPIHGEVKTTLQFHLTTCGCPKCQQEKYDKKNRGFGAVDRTPHAKSSAQKWRAMIERCESKRYDSYKNASICDEWRSFASFEDWFNDPKNGYKDGYHLDKDILVKGNKEYGPNTCCFVPSRINALLVSCKKSRGQFPIGVRRFKNKFTAQLSQGKKRKFLGYYDTIEDAFFAYKQAKEQYIKEVATEYFSRGKITEKVYKALLNYEVEITD